MNLASIQIFVKYSCSRENSDCTDSPILITIFVNTNNNNNNNNDDDDDGYDIVL